MKQPCRLWATLALVLCAAGCAGVAPHASLPAPAAAGYPADLASLARDDDEESERDRGTPISAQYNLETEADEFGPPRVAQLLLAQEQRKAALRAPASLEKAAGLQATQWQALGPSNVGGRVRTLAFDPSNARRLLAGTASGGLWISPDAGNTWAVNNDFLPNLSVTTIAFDPKTPSTVYIGTGEASAGLVGAGVFKSTDGGNTWQFLSATNPDANLDWRFVNRLAVDPAQPQVLLAGVTNSSMASGAIYRSTDGGASWSLVSGLKALDIAFEPGNGSNAVAGLDDGAMAYSRDAGATWTRTSALVPAPSGNNNTSRAEVAFARTQPGLVYASVDNNQGEVWRSNDSGATWQKLSNPKHLSKQGDYDNAIWVDPTDANHVLAAGLDIYESRDGAVTFTKVSDWTVGGSPHADHHALVSPPDFGAGTAMLVDGNDGGVYVAANVNALANGALGYGWTNANNGLAVTQFYSGAGRTAAGGRIVGGSQDNGSLMLSNGVWRAWSGGDGGMVAVDPTTDLVVYGEYVYAALHRTTNGGASRSFICSGLTEGQPDENTTVYCGSTATKKANFIAPFVLDPTNPNRLLAGAASLWANDNARGVPAWHAIKAPLPVTDDFINAIAVQDTNGNVIWVGYNNGEVYRTSNGLAAAPTWTRVGYPSPLPTRRVERITIDHNNPNRVIVAFTGFTSSNVWQTTDGGSTWNAITGNLPNAPVFDVKIHPTNGNWLYAATSVGLFTSESGGAAWSTTNEGPANIRVRELFWIDDTTLGAATFGRGMFKATVASGGPANYQDLWWAGAQEDGWGMSITQHGATLFTALYIYDDSGKPLWTVMPGGSWNAGFTRYTGSLFIPSGSWFGNYDVSRFDGKAAVGTATLDFSSASTGTLTYTINGKSGTKAIVRNSFGQLDATPVATYGDLWWGGSAQNGWGVAINQQYRTLFSVWYTYDTTGNPTWYVMPGGTWINASTFTGTAYRTTSSPWIGGSYDKSQFNSYPVGNLTFTFTGLNNAVMAYTIDGVTQSKPITRQPFP